MQRMSNSKTEIYILWQCLIAGGLGSLAGVAALLRSKEELGRRAFWAAALNSGLFSSCIASVLIWNIGSEHLLLAVAISILSGLGGYSLLDFTIGAARIAISRILNRNLPDNNKECKINDDEKH